MDAEGGCSEDKAGQPAADTSSAVVVVPLTTDEERPAEGSSAVVVVPLTGDERISGDSDTEPFEPCEAGAVEPENENAT